MISKKNITHNEHNFFHSLHLSHFFNYLSTSRILKNNGSAVDAAIATLLCMGVVVPESMGLGGGCTFVIHDR